IVGIARAGKANERLAHDVSHLLALGIWGRSILATKKAALREIVKCQRNVRGVAGPFAAIALRAPIELIDERAAGATLLTPPFRFNYLTPPGAERGAGGKKDLAGRVVGIHLAVFFDHVAGLQVAQKLLDVLVELTGQRLPSQRE